MIFIEQLSVSLHLCDSEVNNSKIPAVPAVFDMTQSVFMELKASASDKGMDVLVVFLSGNLTTS